MIRFPKRTRHQAGGAAISLPLLLCASALSLTGCNSTPSFEGAETTAVASAAPPPAIQTETEKTASDFVSALRSKSYSQANAATTPQFQKRVPLPDWEKGSYKLLLDSKDLSFSPAQMMSRGSKAVLRAQFSGGDKKTYHTNFIFVQSGSAWKIDNVVAPVTHVDPTSHKDAVSKAL